ncbi:MAG: hypothetical protein Q4C45_04305 [Oscillospiraceae bacterium]|nr:hypothetical protein [Oscillospiraceae bacterium]
MTDILTAIIYGENMHLLGKDALEPPFSHEESRLQDILQTLDKETAWHLRDSIQILVKERHVEALRSGIRFGAQLAAELAELPPENR